MLVRDIMTDRPAFCSPDTDLQQVARLMVECDCGAIPVVDSQSHQALGIVTDRDITCRVVAKGQNPIGMHAQDIMSSQIATVTPETPLEQCLSRMEELQIRRMPVVDERGIFCGIVAQADIARVAPEHETAELLKDVSQPKQQPSQVH